MIGGGTWEGAHARHEAARVHHAARRRGGGVAAGGARAAARAHAAHRRAHAHSPRTMRNRQARVAAFLQGLQQLGWTIGRNVRIDYSLGRDGNADDIRKYAAELVALAPDVILAIGSATVGAVAAGDPHRADRVRASSPIRSAPASSTAWRGRAATPPALPCSNTASSGKWLELLKQIAPGVTRAAVLRDPAIAAGIGQFGAIQAVAPSLGVEVSPVNVRDAAEIERAVAAFARAREWRSDRDGERVGAWFIAI